MQEEIDQPQQCVYVCAQRGRFADVHEDKKQDGIYLPSGKRS